MQKANSVVFSVMILLSSLAGCLEEIEEKAYSVVDEVIERFYSPIQKSLCFLSTVYDAAWDATISSKVNNIIDLQEFGQHLEIDIPDTAFAVNATSDAAKNIAYKALSIHPTGRIVTLVIQYIEFLGERACVVLGDEVDDSTWYNYTYQITSLIAGPQPSDISQTSDIAFQATARIISDVNIARSESSPELIFQMNLIANISEDCLNVCGFDENVYLFEEGIGLTSSFGVSRDVWFALDGDDDTYAFSAAHLCPDLHAPPESCIQSGSSILEIPGNFVEGNILGIHYDSFMSCPNDEGEKCSRESVSIDLYYCQSATDCSNPISLDACEGCYEELQISKNSNWIAFILRLSDSSLDNGVALKLFELHQREG
jgi:hypothetical protein